MGVRLQYAKVIDRQKFIIKGGRVHPGLDNEVVVNGEPGTAGAFLVMRAWSDGHGTFTEQWHIESPGGTRIYQSTPREIHIATEAHTERLEDEVADLEVEYTSDEYCVVFRLDGREVARVEFPVTLTEDLGG
jgi:hypothetical protein